MAEETQPRWEGKLIAELKGSTPHQVWPFLEDFCNLHKVLPTLDTCYRVEGVLGQPGLVRYVASTTFGNDSDPSENKWANERLLMMDPNDKCLRYEALDNNLGLRSYVATIRLIPMNDGDGKVVGCMIDWSFVSDPVEGWGFQDMRSFFDFCLQSMAKKIEAAILEVSHEKKEHQSMDQTESQLGHKWEGKVSARVTRASADQIWPLFMDFFNLHKWFPGLSDCHGIHGKNGELGCVRYCGGFSLSSEGTSDTGKNQPVSWSKERLIGLDMLERSLSYEIVDSNIGFTSYVSTVKIIPGDGDGKGGCTIEWSFAVDPVEGWALADLVRKYEVGLQGMAKKMEDSFGN